MATDLKVTELGSPLTPLDGTEILYVVDGGTDRQTTTQDVADLVPAGGDVSHVGSAVVPGNLAAYAQTDGTGIEDSGYAPSDLATAAQGALADSAVQHVGSGVVPGQIPVYAQTDGGGIEDSGYSVDDILTAITQVPQNEQSAAYGLVLADAGKSIDHPASDANARTFTIPANGSVAYPIGTTISFSNMTAEVVTIAITTDTMYLAGTGTTGSRSLAQYGVATARKITSTAWLIVGTGLT